MTPVSLAGTASYLPDRIVPNEFFGDNTKRRRAMFRGSKQRHHANAEETPAVMIQRATERLCDRLALDPAKDFDLLLCNVTCLDMPFMGCGATVSRLIGARPQTIVDVHNAGCVSFVHMMSIARTLMQAGEIKTALICNVQNSAGRVFAHPDNRTRPQSSIPGDGCGVGYLVANDESPIRSIVVKSHPEYADDMFFVSPDGGTWWDPRKTAMHVDFNEDRIASIVWRGNTLVPAVIDDAVAQAGLTRDDIDVLITNQPNRLFLRNWREAFCVAPEAHVHTFAEHGNLFGAAMPISFERAVDTGALKSGGHVVFGGFSHAGDYTASAVVQWGARA